MFLLASIIHTLGIIFFALGAALTCIRRVILIYYDYPKIGPFFFCFWIDGGPFKEIAKTENSKMKRMFFEWINILIPTLIICGFFLLVYSNHFI
jgi:hypothetical protein